MSGTVEGNSAQGAAGAALTEVRLALVCYGGVSLAVYMHGLTKELFKLVRAARVFDAAWEADPTLTPRPTWEGSVSLCDAVAAARDVVNDTEPAYFDALVSAALASPSHPISVNIDVISGTSAGGINGVCLAHALARGRSLEPFRGVWLDQGDIWKLMRRGAPAPGAATEAGLAGVLAGAKRLGSVLGQMLHHPAAGAPLNGDLMCRLVRNALEAMGEPQGSLLRADTSLDLRVTTTDVFGFDNAVADFAGDQAHTDVSYRQVLAFTYDASRSGPAQHEADGGDFTTLDVDSLAFAARATSGFPGAFPSVSVQSYAKAVEEGRPGLQVDQARITRTFVFGDAFGTVSPAQRWYMDGGVLDNGPFDQALSVIAGKRASGPTSRRLIYLEPDPKDPDADTAQDQPSWERVVHAARATIPHRQVFVEALERLRSMNANIAAVGELVRQLDAPLGETLTALAGAPEGVGLIPLGLATLAAGPEVTYEETVAGAAAARAAAQHAVGDLGYTTYCRVRAESLAVQVAPPLARALGYTPESTRAGFLAAALLAALQQDPSWNATDPEPLEVLLGQVDVALRRRRAQLLLRQLSDMFGRTDLSVATRAWLGTVKSQVWDLIDLLRVRSDEMVAAALPAALTVFGPAALPLSTSFSDPREFAIAHRDGIRAIFKDYRAQAQLTGTSSQLWDTLRSPPREVPMQVAQDLRERYVHFPVWDATLFPVTELAQLPTVSPIRVGEFSPRAARCLVPDPVERATKLQGRKLHHFGGFFQQGRRENDYLWGRLDGVELILRLLADEADISADLLDGALRGGFAAVMDNEAPALTSCTPLIDKLRAGLGAVSLGSQPGP